MDNDFLDAARDLGLENDPTIVALSKLLRAQDQQYIKTVNEQMATCERVGRQLDAVPRMLVKMVVP
jgi:hypothetical protein